MRDGKGRLKLFVEISVCSYSLIRGTRLSLSLLYPLAGSSYRETPMLDYKEDSDIDFNRPATIADTEHDSFEGMIFFFFSAENYINFDIFISFVKTCLAVLNLFIVLV